MARSSTTVKALEKALQQLKSQETTPSGRSTTTKAASKADDKRAEQLIKETRRFGDSLLDFYEGEKGRVQSFLDTIDAIESGTYTPTRGGGRRGAGRKKADTQQ